MTSHPRRHSSGVFAHSRLPPGLNSQRTTVARSTLTPVTTPAQSSQLYGSPGRRPPLTKPRNSSEGVSAVLGGTSDLLSNVLTVRGATTGSQSYMHSSPVGSHRVGHLFGSRTSTVMGSPRVPHSSPASAPSDTGSRIGLYSTPLAQLQSPLYYPPAPPPPSAPVLGYDCQVIHVPTRNCTRPVHLTVGVATLQGMRPTMEDEHFAMLRHSGTSSISNKTGGSTTGNRLSASSSTKESNANFPSALNFSAKAESSPAQSVNHNLANDPVANAEERSASDPLTISLIGVLDGHCGRRVAELARKLIPHFFFSHPSLGSNNAQALAESTLQADHQIFLDLGHLDGATGSTGGSTMVAAVVQQRTLHVAWLGDSRAVLLDGSTTIALSEDHKPTDLKEMARVERCGGGVLFGRVGGCLAVSRALGDFEFKCTGTAHVLPAGELMVSNVPDLRQIQITDSTRFLILACDGLWDVLTNQEATSFVSSRLNHDADVELQQRLDGIAEQLALHALDKGSMDNVTVMIMTFHRNDEISTAKPSDGSATPPTELFCVNGDGGARVGMSLTPTVPNRRTQWQGKTTLSGSLGFGHRA